MRFEISQKSFAIGDKYAASVDGIQKYIVKYSVLRLLTRLTVFDSDEEVAQIEKKSFFLRANYAIKIEGFGEATFATKSLWRSTYSIETPSCRYEVLAHKKRKYSIFRDEIQVGMFQKNMISVGDGDRYTGLANSSENPLLIICLVVALDNYSSNDSDGNTITFDLGNICPEQQPYDENWNPII